MKKVKVDFLCDAYALIQKAREALIYREDYSGKYIVEYLPA